MVSIRSWGKIGCYEHEVRRLNGRHSVNDQMRRDGLGLAFGMGRSYGDVCLNPGGVLWDTKGLDRFVAFDRNEGRLRCEAGVLLRDLQRLVIPAGWMLPVVPGTQLATLGGAVANDVHGKNHHRAGCLGDHIERIILARSDGSLIACVRGEPLFAATVGGLGLTGVITEVELQLARTSGPWLAVEHIAYRNLSEFFEISEASERDWEHTVSWIDCLSRSGRGIFMRANSVSDLRAVPPVSRTRRIPFDLPFSLVNARSLKMFNELYYRFNRSDRARLVHYEAFFHPLDGILEWNRIYGKNGFFQYQCVVPRDEGRKAIEHMLDHIAAANMGSFLAVLKTFGSKRSCGMLSFPMPGVTLALDFPNQGERSESLFARLDAIVSEHGGRLYMAKDARMPRALFESGYPRLSEFLPYRDPGISSALSRRLMGY